MTGARAGDISSSLSADGAAAAGDLAATETGALPALAYPALYSAANAASQAGQQGYKWLVVADLGLLGVAAIISVGSQVLPPLGESWSRAIAAALLAIAFVAKAVNRQRGFDAQWFDGRAVAETVKSATWRFAMHAPPFTGDEGANAAFVTTLRDALQARSSLAPHLYQIPADGRQIPRGMEEVRAAPLATRRATYLAERLADQTAWYASKAAANARSANRWFWAGMAAQGGALIVAIALILAPDKPEVVAAFTTVAAAIAAWTQFRRHGELSKSYALAAHELAFLRSEVEGADTEETFRETVAATEDAISREHTMWMAKRG